MMPNMAIPAMIRLVAIGRRMKFSEMFTPSPRPHPHLAPRPSPAPAVAHDDPAAGRQTQLPLRDHGLAQLQTLVHEQPPPHPAATRAAPSSRLGPTPMP